MPFILHEQPGPLCKRPFRLVRANTVTWRTLVGHLLQRNQYLDFLHYRAYCVCTYAGCYSMAVEEDKAT